MYLLIHLEKRLAKIYRNVPGGFVKIADVGDQKLEFELRASVFGVDFERVSRWLGDVMSNGVSLPLSVVILARSIPDQ